MKSNLTTYLLDHNLINATQNGFLQFKSCFTRTTGFLNTATKAANDGRSVIVIVLDMMKAFDRASHCKLLTKVKNYDIKNPFLASFYSYLASRMQAANVNETLSKVRLITFGVIQGSLLGPLPFLLKMNDNFRIIGHGISHGCRRF